MRHFSSRDIDQILDYSTLIKSLEEGFQQDYQVPIRTHLDYTTSYGDENTLLLMPAVQQGKLAGVKIVTVAPSNSKKQLASIQGIYYLMDADTGVPLATLDAKQLTNWRTAASSALASSMLSMKDSSSLLMIGTGSLAPFLIDAHQAVRPIKELYVYGRSKQKAEALVEQKGNQFDRVRIIDDLNDLIHEPDIISSATLSEHPLIQGARLRPGQHIDLVGAFKPTSRESDDQVMQRASIFCDSIKMAIKEAGDLVIPLKSQSIFEKDLLGDLFSLSNRSHPGRVSKEEITVFKSVGHALEDLVAATLIAKKSRLIS